MKHEEFEQQMFAHVNKNCNMKELNRQEIARAAEEERKMKELHRQEVERAAAEEYQFICKRQKIKAVIGIIVLVACFVATTFAMCVLSWTGFLPAVVGTALTAVVSLVFGMSIQSLAKRIKK